MKDKIIIHSLNGTLEDDFEIERLEKRLEMLVLKPVMANQQTSDCDFHCDSVWCGTDCDDHGCDDFGCRIDV